MKDKTSMAQPLSRGLLRAKMGQRYYRAARYLLWIKLKNRFASGKKEDLPFVITEHKTPLLRKLAGVDMQYQRNKIVNLSIAAQRLNGIVIQPGEILSYWRLIGKPTKGKGYLDGIQLKGGQVGVGIGGGLCQLSNLVFWMTLHTPLTVIERHRHGFDVFPDVSRSQPFGSGATCYYPHGDLMIQNDTDKSFQLKITVGKDELFGEWRSEKPLIYRYKIIEKNHEIKSEYWGGYSRHNELYRQTFNEEGEKLDEELMISNASIMMYSPFIEGQTQDQNGQMESE